MPARSPRIAWIAISIFTIFSVFLAACGGATPEVPPAPPTEPPAPTSPPTPAAPALDITALNNVQWALAAYGDPANPTVPPRDILITALFDPDGTLYGFAGCNNYSASFSAAPDGTLTVEPSIAMTLMACPEEQMTAEAAYLEALGQAKSFSFTADGNLAIRYDLGQDQEGALVYVKGAVPLTDTEWVLVSSGDPANPVPAQPGIPVTAVFSEQGTVNGSAGCNGYNAAYSVDGETLTVTAPASTMMFCPAGMEQEAAYLAALGGAQSFQISGQTLVIDYLVEGTPGALTFTSANLPLEGTLWTLAATNGEPLPEDVPITAVFRPGEEAGTGNVGGLAACNNYNGGYTQDGENLTIGPLATTLMLCEETLDQAQQEYLQALEGTQSFAIAGNILMLTGETGTLAFTAERTPLQGALWQLVSLGDVENPIAPVEGANFTAQFIRNQGAPSGVLNGTTGCNEYSAAYTASLNEIKINPPASTENRSCAPGLTDQEQLYFLALNNATQYTILGDSLVIPYDDGRQALVFQGTQLAVAERPPLSALNGTFWYLWSIDDRPVVAGSAITARITVNPDGTSGTMDGSAGCNNYRAAFGEELAVQTAVTSRMFCSQPAGVMEQEQDYLATLGRAYGYWQTGNQLILNSGSGVLTYQTTKPPASTDQAHLLVNQTWFLVSYNTTMSQPGTREPYTIFNPDGTLNGYTGCNELNGSYTTNINQITISDLVTTRAACPDQALQNQEQNMLALLTVAQTYQVVETNLQILSAQGVLNYSLTPLTRPEEAIPPTPVISAPESAPVNTVVTFDASGSTSQVPIVRFSWDFGDGGRATGEVVTHVYTNPGEYRVLMTAIDQRDIGMTASTNITIEAPAPPTEEPSPTEEPTQEPTQAPTGQPTATEAPPTEAPPTEAPSTPEPTEPPAAPPSAAIQGPSTAFIGEPVSFSAAGSTPGSSPIASYQWDFGDGGAAPPSNNPETTYLFSRGGTYQVTVTVTDENGMSSSASTQVEATARLDTTVWRLDSTLKGTVITLQFLGGQLAGFAGCNTYTGSYTATANEDGTYSVTVTGITNTQVACPQEVMDQENGYLSALGQVTSAQLQGNTLALSHPGGTLAFSEVK